MYVYCVHRHLKDLLLHRVGGNQKAIFNSSQLKVGDLFVITKLGKVITKYSEMNLENYKVRQNYKVT